MAFLPRTFCQQILYSWSSISFQLDFNFIYTLTKFLIILYKGSFVENHIICQLLDSFWHFFMGTNMKKSVHYTSNFFAFTLIYSAIVTNWIIWYIWSRWFNYYNNFLCWWQVKDIFDTFICKSCYSWFHELQEVTIKSYFLKFTLLLTGKFSPNVLLVSDL